MCQTRKGIDYRNKTIVEAFEPYSLGSLELRNRIIKTATYEGMGVDGLPSESLVRHPADLARGGVGMTTVAYCALQPAQLEQRSGEVAAGIHLRVGR